VGKFLVKRVLPASGVRVQSKIRSKRSLVVGKKRGLSDEATFLKECNAALPR